MTALTQAARGFRRSMAVMGLFSFASNCLLLIMPLYLLQIYDRVLPSHSGETLVFLTLIAGFGLAILGLLDVVRSVIANRAAARLDATLSDEALRRLVRFGSAAGGNIQPLRDIANLRGLLSSKIVFGLLDLPFSTLFIGLMYLIHPHLFWLTVCGAAVVALIAVVNQFACSRAVARQAEHAMRAGRRAENIARNADSVLAMGMVDNIVERWGRDHAASLGAADAAGAINAWFAGLSRTVRLCLQLGILGYGAYLVLAGQMTAGMIFAASLISGRGLQPIDQTIGAWRQLVGGWESWLRVRQFLSAGSSRRDFTSMPAPVGHLEVAELFQPNPSGPGLPPILRGVSFRLEPGEMLAVVGPSGAGKSTLARTIVGATKPRAGNVRLDGHEIVNWNPEELGRHVGYVSQDVELIPGTIAENISRFDPQMRDEDLIEAARRAHADEMIRQMPKGYDTLIGPGGTQPSGGEKQRIALARAFYGDPRLLILDEPNSNLDPAGEEALHRALNEAKRARVTILVVTQRDSILSTADKILHLKEGMVVDFGPRDEIVAKYHGTARQPPRPPSVMTSRFVAPLRGTVEIDP